tara:strand:- start:5625 stop:5834 length:210 start_codon:yes stop_codon:yes gene_type:complete
VPRNGIVVKARVDSLFKLTNTQQRGKSMGNSPTDKSRDFIKSGMTLITQIESDKILKKVKEEKQEKPTK